MTSIPGFYWDNKDHFDILNLKGESTSGYGVIKPSIWSEADWSTDLTKEWIIDCNYKLICPKEYMFWMD